MKAPTRSNNGKNDAFTVVERISDPQQLIAAFFTSPNVGLAVCDDQLRYQLVNSTLAQIHGIPAEAHLGKRVKDALGNAAAEIEPVMRRVLATGEPVLNLEIACRPQTRTEIGHWIANYFPIKNRTGKVKQVGVLIVEITNQKKLEQSLHTVTRKLLRAQDQEQRRFARDLHDSINQYHAALKMNLLRLRQARPDSPKQRALLTECIHLLDECMAETRTISYLLHPPLLDEIGFASAARWYTTGFAQRSGIKVNLKLCSELGNLPSAVEIALFRVLQEALTNVHRHAHASSLDVEIDRTADEVTLQVRDYGRGIPAQKLRRLLEATESAGVGIASMRERVQELGGFLKIDCASGGTTVRAEIPLPAESYESPQPKLGTEAVV